MRAQITSSQLSIFLEMTGEDTEGIKIAGIQVETLVQNVIGLQQVGCLLLAFLLGRQLS